MSVTSTTQKIIYTGNGTVVNFTIPFSYFQHSDVVVIRHDITTPTAPVDTVLAEGSVLDYTLTGGDPANGVNPNTVTFNVAPLATHQIFIVRSLPLTQLTSYIASGPFPASSHEAGLDRETMISQQIQEQIDRAPKYPKTYTGTTPSFPQPIPSQRTVVMYDASGNLQGLPTSALGITVSGLGDVVITSPVSGQSLVWNGTQWVNQNPSTTNAVEGTKLFYTDARVSANATVVAKADKTYVDTQDSAEATARLAAFNTSSGHHHDGVDARKVRATDLDSGAAVIGKALTADGAGGTAWTTISGGGAAPTTTKGDLSGFDTASTRVPVGTNGQILTADSTQALGLKWAAPATPASFSGTLAGDVTGTQSATAIASATVTGKNITGFVSGSGTVSATDTVLTAINKLDGNAAVNTSNITTNTTAIAGKLSNAANAVANTNLAQMAANTLKGNNTAGLANASDLTAAQTAAMLPAVIGDTGSGGTKGLVPAPASGDAAALKFLKADGTWATPATGTSAPTLYTGSTSPNPSYVEIFWDFVKADMTATNSALVKNANNATYSNAYSTSSATAASTGGSFEIKLYSNMYSVYGLSNIAAPSVGGDCTFGFAINGSGNVEVYEAGTFRTTSGVAASNTDVYKVTFTGTTVTYYRNGTLYYTSATSPSGMTLTPMILAYGTGNVLSLYRLPPVGSVVGNTGDYYIHTVTRDLYKLASGVYGVQTNLGGLKTVTTKTSAYTATSSDDIILADATSGAVTITFPRAATNPGKVITVKKIDSTANFVTLARSSTDLFDGLSSYSLLNQYVSQSFVSDGVSKWSVVASQAAMGMAGSDTLAYSPSFTGLGTVSATDAFYSRVGDQIYVQMKFTTGTTTATEARVTLPPGMIVDSSKLPNIRLVGHAAFGAAAQGSNTGGTTVMDVLAEPGASYFTFSIQNTINSGLTKTTGSNGFPSNTPTSFFAQVPIAGWSANVTMGASSTYKISSYLANGTLVTTTPSALGQVRAMYKNGTNTATGTNIASYAVGYTPTVSDGMRIVRPDYGSAGNAGQPNRYEIFIGKNKNFRTEWYANAGRTGYIDTTPRGDGGTGTASFGVFTTYDPSTGCILIDALSPINGGGGSGYVGNTIDPVTGTNQQNTGYFDITVSENALAVGIQAPRSEIRFNTWAGFGSTNTLSPYFTNVDISTGTAFSYSNSSATGLVVTILEDGLYSVEFAGGSSAGQAQGVTISKNYSANMSSTTVPVSSRICSAYMGVIAGQEVSPSCGRTTFLAAGSTIRPHSNANNTPASPAMFEFAVTKVSN